MTRRRSLTGAASAAMLATAVLAGPAYADTRVVTDPNESGTASDTSRVVVRHLHNAQGEHGRVVIRASVGRVGYGDYFRIWLDKPGGAAPQYFGEVRPEAGYEPLERVRGWRTEGPGHACRGWDAGLLGGPDQILGIRISRACLGNPAKVRVALLAVYERDNRVIRDWVPAPRTLTRWVRVSTPDGSLVGDP